MVNLDNLQQLVRELETFAERLAAEAHSIQLQLAALAKQKKGAPKG